MNKRCDTCRKAEGENKCKVLNEMIGKEKDCFAHTTDRWWERKVKRAVEKYLEK